MRKRLLALMICAVLVSTIAATSAVSAKQDNKGITTNIRHYNVMSPVMSPTSVVIGKLTVDLKTGHYVFDANYGRNDVDEWNKDYYKDGARADPPKWDIKHLVIYDLNAQVWIYDAATLNKGGNVHGEGFLTDKEAANLPPGMDILTWFKEYGDDAYFVPGYWTL